MAISTSIYGSRIEADEYFSTRLHETAWSNATVEDQDAALLKACRAIDRLSFKGCKAPVHTLITADPDATDAEIRVAEASQELQFPRGTDTEVPEDIRVAQYEEAYAYLDGQDPELELEALSIAQQQVETVKTSFTRRNVPAAHITNGIVSLPAWRRLLTFLRDDRSLRLLRV